MTDVYDRLGGARAAVAVKAPCEAATTVHITLAAEQTIDGVALIEGDRCLVKNQNDAKQNGIYLVSTGNWRRAQDFDSNLDFVHGTRVYVHSGATGAGEYKVDSPDPIELNVSEILISGVGELTSADISDGAVTNAKLANAAQATIKGRAAGAGTGAPTDLSASDVRSIINVANGAQVNDDAAAILAKLLTVDGTGSTLDADTLDGQNANDFQGADASLEALSGDAPANTVALRNDDSDGAPGYVKISALTDRSSFGSGAKIMIEQADGTLRKIDYDDLPGSGGGISNLSEDSSPELGGLLETNGNDIMIENGDAIKTGVTEGDTALVQAYDTNATAYVTFGTLTAGNPPTFDLADGVTANGGYIYRAGGTAVPIAEGGTGQAAAADAFNALKQAASDADTGVVELATVAEVRSAAAGKVLTSAHLETAAVGVTMASSAWDWEAGFFRTLQLTASSTLALPSNPHPGTSRSFYLSGSTGGPFTLEFATTSYGGTLPTLTDITTAQTYLVSLFCVSTTHLLVSSINGSPPTT